MAAKNFRAYHSELSYQGHDDAVKLTTSKDFVHELGNLMVEEFDMAHQLQSRKDNKEAGKWTRPL